MSSKIIINNQTKQVTVDGVAINTSTALPTATDQGSVLVSDNSGAFISYTGPTFMRNRIINGDMRVAQRGTAAVTSISSQAAYAVDRWAMYNATTTTLSAQQSSDAPAGFSNSILFSTTSAINSSAAQNIYVIQRIEGCNVSDLAYGTSDAKILTASFWVKSSVAGTYSGVAALYPVAGSSVTSYVFTYTISQTNTWEKKTVQIPGNQTYAIPNLTNGVGIYFSFDLGSGTNAETSASTWIVGDFNRKSGCVKWANNASATFYLTGVQLEVGSTATPFEYRPMQYELALCQRYYARLKSSGTDTYVAYGAGTCQSSTVAWIYLPFPQSMRTSPTLTQSNTCITRDVTTTRYAVTAFSGYYCTDTSAMVYISASGLTGQLGVVWCANNNAAAYVELNAEL